MTTNWQPLIPVKAARTLGSTLVLASALGLSAPVTGFAQEAEAAASTATAAGPATAEEAAAAGEDSLTPAVSGGAMAKRLRIDEVVVTARKRSENLQDVPLSIKALSGDELKEIGAKTFTEYADEIPSLNFASTGEGGNRINIRGLQAPQGVGVVAYLIDDIPQQDAGSPDTELFDIENVQVLRGPQGTLYGAGAVGGAIIIRTSAPDPEAFDWAVRSSVSINEESALTTDNNVMVNIPIMRDVIGFRAVGFHRKSDGWITVREPDETNPPPLNSYNSENVVAQDANAKEVYGFRLALSFDPLDNLSFVARYSKQNSDLGAGRSESPSLTGKWGDWTMSEGGLALTKLENEYELGTLHASWDLPFAVVESITGFANNTLLTDTDIGVSLPTDAMLTTFLPIVGAVSVPDPLADIIVENGVYEIVDAAILNEYKVFNQEFRLISTGDGPFQYTLGLFYQTTDRVATAPIRGRGNFAGAADSDVFIFEDRERRAVFGEASYNFTEKFSAVLGMRYFEEDVSVLDSEGQNKEGNFDSLSPKFGLNYAVTEDILLYTVYAEGFRSGGFNTPLTDPPVNGIQESYDSDLLTSYEIGMNSQWFDQRLTFNAAIFYAAWEDLQMDLLLENDLGRTQNTVANFGEAHSAGFEWDLIALLSEAWLFKFSGSFLEAELDEDAPNPQNPDEGIPAGTRLENVPDWAFNVGVTHNYFFANNMNLTSNVSFNYSSETIGCILDPEGCAAAPRKTLNARVTLRGADANWDVALFANNITDEANETFNFTTYDTVFRDEPRTFGIRMSYKPI
ncbi:MAG: TonB-dependent receptor [Alphaproteobacteria bacterium]